MTIHGIEFELRAMVNSDECSSFPVGPGHPAQVADIHFVTALTERQLGSLLNLILPVSQFHDKSNRQPDAKMGSRGNDRTAVAHFLATTFTMDHQVDWIANSSATAAFTCATASARLVAASLTSSRLICFAA